MTTKELKSRAAVMIAADAAAHLIDGGDSDDFEAAKLISKRSLEIRYRATDKFSKYWIQYRVWREKRPQGRADWSDIASICLEADK